MHYQWRHTRGHSSANLNYQPEKSNCIQSKWSRWTTPWVSNKCKSTALNVPSEKRVSPDEWCKFHSWAADVAEKGAGSRAGTWGDVPCVCGEWWWQFDAWPHSQVAGNVLPEPPGDFSSLPLLDWALMGSWHGWAHLWTETSLLSSPCLTEGRK